MNKKSTTTRDAIELRRQAEAKLDGQKQSNQPVAAAETQRLLHELQVHQIELEMQNEELRRTRTELEASQTRYFDIFDLAPVGYLIISEKNMIVEANLAAASLLGMARGSLTNYSFPLFIQRADRIVYHQHWKKLLETSDPQACELRMKRRDGSPFWARLEMSAGLDADGAPLQRVVLSDISERKLMEDALRGSEQKYRILFDTMNEGIALNEIVLDEQGEMIDYRVLEVNQAFYSTADFVGPASLAVGSLATKLYGMPLEVIKTFWHEHRDRKTAQLVEFTSPFKGRHFIISTSPFVNNRFVTSFFDITKRKRAEEALRDAHWRMESIIEATQVGTWEWNIQTGETIYNEKWAAIIGYTLAELAPISIKTWEKLAHPDDLKRSYELLEMHFAGELPNYYYESRMQHKDGHWVWVLDRGRVMTRSSEGKPLMMFGTHQDISARKQAEFELQTAHDLLEQRVVERTAELRAANLDLEKAARMKDEFLAAMSHELRTPLTGILGLSEVLQLPGPDYDLLTEKQKNHITNIRNSGQHLLEMVNDILDFSSIGSGKFELDLVPCSLAEICQSSLRKMLAQANAKHLQHNFSISPEHILLSADARRLQKILLNLLDNAVKFTPQGGSFGIEVQGNSSEKQVRITVWDTGIGIKAEDLPRLFQPFIQLDASLARQYNGTGLGLALVRQLTELHGGSVSVESTFGSGSRFTVCLPWQPLPTSPK